MFFEDLNLDGMKRLWGRKVSDLGLYQLLQRLEFKAKEHSKIIGKVDRFFPSSKTCSNCSAIKEILTLKDRVFKCQNCGYEINRDLNAAINILTVGISTAGLEGI